MGYCCKFIRHYAHDLWRIYHRCRLDTYENMGSRHREPQLNNFGTIHSGWSKNAVDAIQTLHDAICKAPVLALPEEVSGYILHSDTRKYAVRVVLSQNWRDRERRVIPIRSMMYKHAQTQHPTFDRGLPALLDAAVHWHYYLHWDRNFMLHMGEANFSHIKTWPHLSTRCTVYTATFQIDTYDICYIPHAETVAGDPLSRQLDLRQECCQSSQCWVTQLVIQNSTEWLCIVATLTKDDSWSTELVQILVSKYSQEHPLMVSALSILYKAWAHSHCFCLDVGLFNQEHQKQDPGWQRDQPHWLHILTPLRNWILWEAQNTPLEGHFRVTNTYMVIREGLIWPGMYNRVQD